MVAGESFQNMLFQSIFSVEAVHAFQPRTHDYSMKLNSGELLMHYYVVLHLFRCKCFNCLFVLAPVQLNTINAGRSEIFDGVSKLDSRGCLAS